MDAAVRGEPPAAASPEQPKLPLFSFSIAREDVSSLPCPGAHFQIMRYARTVPDAALITGATSGIGEAFARALPRATSLLLTARDEAALGRLAADLGASGRLIETLGADLSTDAGLGALCTAGQSFGVDLLVCNAGVGPFGEFLTVEEAALRATILANVMAPVVLARRLLPGIRAERVGRRAGLIIVSSGAAFLPVPRLATYAASKAFDLSLTEALGAEVTGQPIDVLALCPTLTRSRFAERSGFGRNLPGAQSPNHVARSAPRRLDTVARSPSVRFPVRC